MAIAPGALTHRDYLLRNPIIIKQLAEIKPSHTVLNEEGLVELNS